MSKLDDSAVVTSRPPVRSDESETTTDPPHDPLVIDEHTETAPFQLSDADATFLEAVAADTGAISITYTADGEAILGTSSYVGVVTLPSGLRIEVTPKETVSRVLDLLQYALDVPTRMVTHQTRFTEAHTFIDAFGALFSTQLADLLRAGIRRDYKRVSAIEQSVRGRLDVQRQLQRPTPIPTDFAVDYDSLTANTVVNQAILAATEILTALVGDDTLAKQLDRQAKQLRRFVEPAYVSLADLETVALTRLDARYEDILELAKLVLARRFFDDITSGELATFGLFLNMNRIFEAVVERAFRDAVARCDTSLVVEGQGSISALIEGPHAVDMTPDVVVKNPTGAVLLVGDAKWKIGTESSSDIYQLTSYMLADTAPGVIVYPYQGGTTKESTVVTGTADLSLTSIQLPTAAPTETYTAYTSQLVDRVESFLRGTIPQRK